MDLLGNLVDALRDASLQANPGHRQRYQQALHRHAHGGIMPDPDLNPDSDDDDTPRVKIPPPIFKGLPRRKARHSHICHRRLDGSYVLQRRSVY